MRSSSPALVCGLLLACSGPAKAPPAAAAAATPEQTPPAPPAAPPAPAPAPDPPAANDEACGQIIVVAYKGAAHAKPEIKRDKAEAAKRAYDLLTKINSGSDFSELARTESDAPSSAAHGGIMGSFGRNDWPELHRALLGPIFELEVGQVAAQPVAADYGFVIVRRCAVEKAHGRHILVRFKGAKSAPKQTKRSKAEAQKIAAALLKKVEAGADFAELARTASEDGSASRGGDVGLQPRGVLAMPFEQALFALKPGQHSGVVETEFGFHIIERVPD